MKPTIKFSKNWNNKLDNDFFTTIRLWTQDKENWFNSNIGELFEVTLKNKPHSQAHLLNTYCYTLRTISPLIIMLDTGLFYDQALCLFKEMYDKRAAWKDRDTKIILVLFQKAKNEAQV